MEFKWETLEEKDDVATQRAKIDGGWLYRTVVVMEEHSCSVSMVFVPDSKAKEREPMSEEGDGLPARVRPGMMGR